VSITKESVVEKMKGTDSILLSVLPAEEFLKLHILGSYNIPLQEDGKIFVQEVMDRFGKDKFFITYASNITSRASIDAAEALQGAGIHAEAYLSGMREWSQGGLPTEGTLAKV